MKVTIQEPEPAEKPLTFGDLEVGEWFEIEGSTIGVRYLKTGYNTVCALHGPPGESWQFTAIKNWASGVEVVRLPRGTKITIEWVVE